jgi:hypothetical protein
VLVMAVSRSSLVRRRRIAASSPEDGRRTLEGQRRVVLHLRASALTTPDLTKLPILTRKPEAHVSHPSILVRKVGLVRNFQTSNP